VNDVRNLHLHCVEPQKRYSGGSESFLCSQNQTRWLRHQPWDPFERKKLFIILSGTKTSMFQLGLRYQSLFHTSLTAPQAGEACVTASTRAKGGGRVTCCSIGSIGSISSIGSPRAPGSSVPRLAFSRACSLCRASSISSMMALWSFCRPEMIKAIPWK